MKPSLPEIHLHPRVSAIWGIKAGDIWTVAGGKKQTQVRMRERMMPQAVGQPPIPITGNLARELHLPPEIVLNITSDGEILRVGPLVGILAGPYNNQTGSFGSQDKFFRSLLHHMRHLNGLAYVFTYQDLDRGRKLVHGYYLTEDDGPWRRMWLPLPDVCYNRYYHHSGENTSRCGVTALKKYGIKVFNTGVGDKWQVHKRLMLDKAIASHLPETRLVKSNQTLTSMLGKYQQVYVKPINGSKGHDITRVSRHQGSYLLKSTNDVNGRVVLALPTVGKGGPGGRMKIVQQGIKTPGNERHFDLRVMVQKDRYNEWHLSGIAVRLGAKGRITTNLATKGRAEKLEKTLGDFGWDYSRILSINLEIEDLALRIARTLDRYAEYLGELGLDFIIDTRGKVWFLEANPKPARKVFTLIDAEMRHRAVSRPMEYACWLAGF